jgi:fatty-acyl-CoA synthase/long-chain acyl-CoA synthetase
VGVITVGKIRRFDYVEMIEEIREDLPNLEHIIVWNEDDPERGVPFSELMKSDPEAFKGEEVSPEDIACILYTSGTTGLPKGVVYSQHIALEQVKSFLDIEPQHLDYTKTTLNPMPLFNAAGIHITYQNIFMGNKVVYIDRFNPKEMLRLIEAEKITQGTGAPAIMRQVVNLARKNEYNLSSLQVLGSGGSKITADLVKEMKDLFGIGYTNVYAITEVGCVSRVFPDDPLDMQLNTVGRPPQGVEVKVTDENRQEVPYGHSGEFAFRSPAMMVEYYNNPEKTAEVFDEDGFYYSGDLGSMDENGILSIFDRKKDMIIRGAQNIFPSEIESYLNTHPKIQMSAVIGVPSQVSGEKVRAYVQLFEGEEMTGTDVVEYCRGNIAAYKIPEEVRFADSFPLSRMGKVQKKTLREEALKEMETS